MKPHYYATIASNFIHAYDKYTRTYSKSQLPKSSFPNQFFLLKGEELSIGLNKAQQLLNKTALENDYVIIIQTSLSADTSIFKDHVTGLGQYIKSNQIIVDQVFRYENNLNPLKPLIIEDLMADSFALNYPLERTYQNLQPRTISILPVRQGCQARCAFCFSEGSSSVDIDSSQIKQMLTDGRLEYVLASAKTAGAIRCVLTGGGEPTLLKDANLKQLLKLAHQYFPNKVVLITNGYRYGQLNDADCQQALKQMDTAGLTNLSISRHHYNKHRNAEIMKIDNKTEQVVKQWKRLKDEGSIAFDLRVISILQRNGIDSETEIAHHLTWLGASGVEEVCFKELYVSSSRESYYHNAESNQFSHAQQVPLKLLIDFLERNGFQRIAELPWGAPVYAGAFNGYPFKIAAYTEPSVSWELVNGIARSWNLMSNGDCLATLEDRHSLIEV